MTALKVDGNRPGVVAQPEEQTNSVCIGLSEEEQGLLVQLLIENPSVVLLINNIKFFQDVGLIIHLPLESNMEECLIILCSLLGFKYLSQEEFMTRCVSEKYGGGRTGEENEYDVAAENYHIRRYNLNTLMALSVESYRILQAAIAFLISIQTQKAD